MLWANSSLAPGSSPIPWTSISSKSIGTFSYLKIALTALDVSCPIPSPGINVTSYLPKINQCRALAVPPYYNQHKKLGVNTFAGKVGAANVVAALTLTLDAISEVNTAGDGAATRIERDRPRTERYIELDTCGQFK